MPKRKLVVGVVEHGSAFGILRRLCVASRASPAGEAHSSVRRDTPCNSARSMRSTLSLGGPLGGGAAR